MRKQRRPRRAGGAGERQSAVEPDVEVEIERMLPGGMGLAHDAGGRTLLVALSAPGDRVRARIRQVRGAVAFASVVEVLTPSPVRVEPPCPYFGRCGGCDFQQLNYEAQLASKVEIIRDCLRRIARVEPPSQISITPAPAEWHYRSRAQWQHDPRRASLGYFERGSHNVCDVVECPVVAPALQETLTDLRQRMRARALPEDVYEFQAAAGDDGVTLSPPVGDAREHESLRTIESVRTIGGERYRFDAECFFQINHDLLAPLVREATADARGEIAVDLYCGVGLFTLPLARRFDRVVGVEGNASACAYARLNLSDAGLTNSTIETSPVGQWLAAHADTPLAPVDFLLLDPPRAGAEGEALRGILRLQPRRIAYVSCDPATLSRDLRTLTGQGYRLDSITAFDLFPQTHHVETLAHLSLMPV